MSETCASLHSRFTKMQRLMFPFDVEKIPLNGIYILFEEGEKSHCVDRIVRIGTHTGNNQLRSRLQQHFLKENKDRSIFRKNIGRAILHRAKDPFLEQWNWDLTTRKAKDALSKIVDRDKQDDVENQVSEYIRGKFSFVVFEVPEKKKRIFIESKIISTISLCDECIPSSSWLGLYSPKRKIRESSLWLVNELYKEPLSERELIEVKLLANN